jgi:hypothetical protein
LSLGFSISIGGGGGGVNAVAPNNPVEGMSLWIDFGDAASVFQDAAMTTPAVADNDPVRGVADKSGNGRKMTMPGGFDPLLWRPSLMACDVFRHDAVFPSLKSSGWNVGNVMGSGSIGTIFLIGYAPDPLADALSLGSEGYTGLTYNYNPQSPSLVASIWNGASYDMATIAAAADGALHVLMLRLAGGNVEVAFDDMHVAARVSTPTIGMDAVSLTQPLTTSYGVPPFTARYGTLLVYPTALTEDACLAVAAWAFGRW